MRFGKSPFGRPVKICSTRRDSVSPIKVEANTYGNKCLNPTLRVRQNTVLSPIPTRPRHLPIEIKKASTADSKHAVAKAEINIVSI